jgi:predicted  nucleic acid-binding Zn-ribbon protein
MLSLHFSDEPDELVDVDKTLPGFTAMDADMSMTENVITFTKQMQSQASDDSFMQVAPPSAAKALTSSASVAPPSIMKPSEPSAYMLQDFMKTLLPKATITPVQTFEQIQQQLLEMQPIESVASVPCEEESFFDTSVEVQEDKSNIVDEKPFGESIEVTLNPAQFKKQLLASTFTDDMTESLDHGPKSPERTSLTFAPNDDIAPSTPNAINETFEIHPAESTSSLSSETPINQTFTLEESFDQPLPQQSNTVPKTSSLPVAVPVEQVPEPNAEEQQDNEHVMSLKEFLQLIQVRFLDKVSSGRRTTMAPVAMSISNTLTFQEKLLQAHVVQPELGVYQWACEHLSELTDNLKSSITSLEHTHDRAYQRFARAAVEMDAEVLSELQRSMSSLKARSRGEARESWNAFHSKLLHRVSEAFGMEMQGVEADEVVAAEHIQLLKDLMVKAVDAKKRMQSQYSQNAVFLSSGEQVAECAALFDALKDGQAQFEASQAKLLESQTQKLQLQSRLHEIREQNAHLQAKIVAAKSQLAQQTLPSQEEQITQLQRSHTLMRACHHWTLIGSSNTTVTVHLFGHQVVLTKREDSPTITAVSVLRRPVSTFWSPHIFVELCQALVGQELSQVRQYYCRLFSLMFGLGPSVARQCTVLAEPAGQGLQARRCPSTGMTMT